ncbi:putative pectinesterase/pectinesterase inhibitor 45 [Prosopis cineraria]|uniref:putative pectinesterase/pectinesterase inhibitor 45 n=1 Tax=Prosopis cineraria TaxID=364024 RepID=UPI00240F7F2E|nr:putative pectinesterase/pectinesterase inhibitor 45 [Prosopis cineraria]
MAFQDFDLITEKRKNDRKQKLKRRIAIGAVCTIVIIGLIGAAAFVIVSNNNEEESELNDHNKKSPPSSSKGSPNSNSNQISVAEKLVKTICDITDYKDKCETSLDKEVKKDPKIAQPRDVLKLAIGVAADELNKALNKTKDLNFLTDKEKGAYEDCKKLLDRAKDDLGNSSSHVGSIDMNKLALSSSDLNSWLSAVISFQGACLDGFSEGKLKTEMQSAFQDSMEYVSNSLAILSQLGSVVSSALKEGANRHLLSTDDKGLPEWMNDEDRRMLKAADDKPTPNVTVAGDGSGDFKTISEALKAIPQKYDGRYVVYVKAGTYDETVLIEERMVNLTLYGDGSQKSIITGNKNFVDGVRTFQTASFAVEADGFLGKAMGFRNTAGPEKHQAVAARVQGDRAVFVNCRFEAFQDTLYALAHRQFYRSCVISGTVDFIFGDAAAIFQNCIMNIRKPLDNQQNIVTAQGRMDPRETTAIVLQGCQIKADDSLAPMKDNFKSYLGRPWKEYSRTVVMESEIDDIIDPEGWMEWEGDFALSTLFYAEFNNTGAGANTDNRVKWPGYKKISRDEASNFTVDSFLAGNWISGINVPVQRGLYN